MNVEMLNTSQHMPRTTFLEVKRQHKDIRACDSRHGIQTLDPGAHGSLFDGYRFTVPTIGVKCVVA
jgi:hypothetical protein